MSKQFYGIKYPFTTESNRLTFFDMNETKEDGVISMLLHIILTPKGQRLRHPNFGTDIIKFIFEPDDSNTWEGIKEEIRRQVSLYLPEVSFNDMKIIHDENKDDIYLSITYDIINKGNKTRNNTMVKL